MSSNEPVKNGGEVIYEMFHILNCGFEIKLFPFLDTEIQIKFKLHVMIELDKMKIFIYLSFFCGLFFFTKGFLKNRELNECM